ncbi:hypothetical protein ACTOWA_05035 [Herbaspirillum seropedicae]|uniref:hypothetical protein n=1 Tax=Herbaspirillum seropedicae TaxID=964 RepID=UPI003F8D84F4
MSERIEARGDIGQVIDGNVNEAPRQNNVVNFNLGSEKGPQQTLTDLQRKRIAGLVRELCTITQEETLDVYRVILTEFGAERMKDMPREKYHEVVAQVERWIAENKHGTRKILSAAVDLEVSETKQSAPGAVRRCETCSEKDVSYARLQRMSRGQWILSAFLAFVCGFLLYRMPASVNVASTAERHCFFEGQPYSEGSTIKGGAGTLRECIIDESRKSMAWIDRK